jgi:prophage regulatory protein
MNAPAEQSQLTLVRLDEVIRRTGLGRSAIYAKIKEGKFPGPIKLGERASGWISSELTEWINARIKDSRGEQGSAAASVPEVASTKPAPRRWATPARVPAP